MFIRLNDKLINADAIKHIEWFRSKSALNHYPYKIIFVDGEEADIVSSTDLFDQFFDIVPAQSGFKLYEVLDDNSFITHSVIAFHSFKFSDHKVVAVTADGIYDLDKSEYALEDPLGKVYSASRVFDNVSAYISDYFKLKVD